MKLSFQQLRDRTLYAVGLILLALEFIGPLVPGPPNITIVIAALAVLGGPTALSRDERS
jgi:hypothetical protein